MTRMPGPDKLAKLVSGVTETMFGMTFDLAADTAGPAWNNKLHWRTVMLPLSGTYPMTVVIASDPQGGRVLASEMFGAVSGDVDAAMIDDSLSELVNIIAGQVKGVLGNGVSLGLPRVVDSLDRVAGTWHTASLKNNGCNVLVWVALIDSGLSGLDQLEH